MSRRSPSPCRHRPVCTPVVSQANQSGFGPRPRLCRFVIALAAPSYLPSLCLHFHSHPTVLISYPRFVVFAVIAARCRVSSCLRSPPRLVWGLSRLHRGTLSTYCLPTASRSRRNISLLLLRAHKDSTPAPSRPHLSHCPHCGFTLEKLNASATSLIVCPRWLKLGDPLSQVGGIRGSHGGIGARTRTQPHFTRCRDVQISIDKLH